MGTPLPLLPALPALPPTAPFPPVRAPLPTATAAGATQSPSLRASIPRPSPSRKPVPAVPAPPPPRGVLEVSMQLRAFAAPGDDLGREEMTRPLAPDGLDDTTVARGARELVATSWVSDADVDVTAPLAAVAPRAGLYDSDVDLTRPLFPRAAAAFLPLPAAVPTLAGGLAPIRRTLVLPPPPLLERPPVAVAVSVPRRSTGVVEQSPSIQITSTASAAEVPAPLAPPAPSAPGVPVVVGNFSPRTVEQDARQWLIALAALVFGATLVGVVMRPRDGSVVVTVSGPSGGAVRGVSIRVDGAETCASSPCEVKDLAPGAHFVSASATGLSASANRAFLIGSGEHAAQHVALSQAERTSAGLNVSAIGDGLRVFVDGRDLGVPPISLDRVEPGQHTIRIVGEERYYQPYEESVKLGLGEVRSVGPVRLRVIRGRLQLLAGDGAEGARVAVDGRRVFRLPAVLELSAAQSHEVTATRPGFEELSTDVVFDEDAEKSVTVQLERSGGAVAAPIATDALRRVTANARPRAATPTHAHVATPARPAPQPASTGPATLDLNSIPRAAVVVNGRPVGTTPLRGIRVEPGRQTIIFIHPQLGRKIASASVAPGGRTAVGVKF